MKTSGFLSAGTFHPKEEQSITDISVQKHAKQPVVPASLQTYKDLNNVKEIGYDSFLEASLSVFSI